MRNIRDVGILKLAARKR